MPKIVDRRIRRMEIARAYLKLMSQGQEAEVTTRALSQELGVATGTLWNYFEDTRALMVAAFELYFADMQDRIDRRTDGRHGLPALAVVLHELLPQNAVGQKEAVIAMRFYSQTAFTEHLYEVQRRVEHQWREMITGRILEALDEGALQHDADPGDLAELLVVLVVGLQIEYVTGAANGSPQRQWHLLNMALQPWRVSTGDAPLEPLHLESVDS